MKTGIGHLNEIRLKSAKYLTMSYRIRFIATPGFYFSKWVFGWGSIQKIPQVYSRKTPKTGLFTLPGALFKSGAAIKWIR